MSNVTDFYRFAVAGHSCTRSWNMACRGQIISYRFAQDGRKWTFRGKYAHILTLVIHSYTLIFKNREQCALTLSLGASANIARESSPDGEIASMHQGVDMHAATKRKLHLSEKVYTAIIKQMCILVCYMCGRLQFDFEKIIYLKIAARKYWYRFSVENLFVTFFPRYAYIWEKIGWNIEFPSFQVEV